MVWSPEQDNIKQIEERLFGYQPPERVHRLLDCTLQRGRAFKGTNVIVCVTYTHCFSLKLSCTIGILCSFILVLCFMTLTLK